MKTGKNSIISKQIRVRYPEHFEVCEFSIVDDFCYFSTKVKICRNSHVANGCSVGGGPECYFELGEFSSLSAGVRVWCGSDDFVNDLVTISPPGCVDFKRNFIKGDVILGKYTAVGSNSVVLPNNRIPEGTTIGALSFVPTNFQFEPWTVYAGAPIRKVAERNKAQVLEQIQSLNVFLKKAA